MDTIFALASAPGKAGVSVVRVSGPNALPAVKTLTGFQPSGRGMCLKTLRSRNGHRLDQAMILFFEAPGSFTGEDVVEFQLHGSTAIVSAVLKELGDMPGCRLAEPGEFTRRALENGKMDLAQVEGLADLIDAETEAQRQQALRVFSGDLGRKAEDWRKDLIRAAALIEVTIDFADEEIPEDVAPEVLQLLGNVIKSLSELSAGVGMAERVRAGFEVAIVGPPNVGKSTLLNALAGRQAAITSEFAGTTRDVIEVRMDLDGIAVTLLDTAGLRESTDEVENIGISLARSRAEQADMRVFLTDQEITDISVRKGDLVLKPKADLRTEKAGAVSGQSGEGIGALISAVTSELKTRAAGAGLATRERHRVAIERARDALLIAQEKISAGPEEYDIAAEEIRHAIRGLESLVGRVDVENLLDEIFSSFCLGK